MTMDPKSQLAADTASQTASSVTSMDKLFRQLPGHVRIEQRRELTTRIVGYPESTKAKDLARSKGTDPAAAFTRSGIAPQGLPIGSERDPFESP
jgi:hypothetical protein